MATAATTHSPDILRRIFRLQVITLVWMAVEAVVALTVALRARSPALLGFGSGSLVELFSAAVVLWRFRASSDSSRDEKRAARIAGALLFVLAACVVVTAGLALRGYGAPRPSLAGILLLLVATAGMPWLASRKRKLAAEVRSASLKADATESALCGYMSWIALAGLLVNALFHKSWADPVAALALVPIMIKEGWDALHGSRPGCQCG